MGFFNVTEPAAGEVSTSTLRSHLQYSSTGVDVFPRFASAQTATITAGTCFFSFFTPLATMTVSQVTMASGATNSSGLTYAAIGLYTFDGTTATLVARTASDTTLFNSTNTAYTRSFDTTGGFPASYQLVEGERYAIGVLVTGTTAPNVYAGLFVPNTVNALAPRLTGAATGQTALPTTRSTFTQTTTTPWGRFS